MTARRPVLLLRAAAFGLALLAGATAARAADVLRLLVPLYSEATVPYFRHLAEDFDAANPGLTVEVDAAAWPDLPPLLTPAQGHAPDLAIVRGAALADLVRAGTVDPLEARMSAEFKSRFIGDLLAAGRIGARVYGLPFAVQVPALFYNRDLLARGGIAAPPADWPALLADAAPLQAAGIAAFGLAAAPGAAGPAWRCAALADGTDLIDQHGRPAVAAPPGVAALTLLRALVTQGGTEPVPSEQDAAAVEQEFVRGAVAMVLGPPPLLAQLLRDHPALRFGVAALPAAAAAPSCASGDMVVLLHVSTLRPAAFKFLDFLFTRTPRLALARAEGFAPVTRGELRDPSVANDADRALFGRLVAQARFAPALPGWPAADRALDGAVAAALRGELSPQAALDQAAAAMAPLLPPPSP